MSINYNLIRQLEDKLKRYVDERLATLVKFTTYSRSTADGAGDKVQGYPVSGADQQPYDYAGRRVQPFGHRSVPPAGVSAVWVGVEGSGAILGEESKRYGPSDLADGETAVYNKVTGTLVKLKADGSVNITDKGGASVVLDGSGNVTVQGAPNGNVSVQAGAGAGSVTVSATPMTGSVKLGPVGSLQVLVLGALDPVFGAPVLQAPAAVASIVKAG